MFVELKQSEKKQGTLNLQEIVDFLREQDPAALIVDIECSPNYLVILKETVFAHVPCLKFLEKKLNAWSYSELMSAEIREDGKVDVVLHWQGDYDCGPLGFRGVLVPRSSISLADLVIAVKNLCADARKEFVCRANLIEI